MTKKHRILFVVPTLFGHLGPSIPVARHLMEQGNTVGYCTGAPARQALADIGVKDFYPRDTYHQAIMDKRMLVKGVYEFLYNSNKVYSKEVLRKYYLELISAFEAFRPDIVYMDTYDNLSQPVVNRAGIPYAHVSAMVPYYFELDIPPVGADWDIRTPIRNRFKLIPFLLLTVPLILIRLNHQKKALKSIDNQWKIKDYRDVSPYLYILFSTDGLEFPRREFIPQMFYVGPSMMDQSSSTPVDFPWSRIDETQPLIYIAAGTLFINQYKKFYKDTLDALSEKNFAFPVQVVMAMGKKEYIDELGEIPSNFIVVPYAPQIELLKKARLMVTHGGANSVNEALFFGKPMLVVHLGGDRLAVGQRVAYRGAGICMDVDTVSPEKIKQHVITLLHDPGYTAAAKTIMDSYRKCDGAKTASGLIQQLADTRRPVYRKKGAPITLEKINDLPEYLDVGRS